MPHKFPPSFKYNLAKCSCALLKCWTPIFHLFPGCSLLPTLSLNTRQNCVWPLIHLKQPGNLLCKLILCKLQSLLLLRSLHLFFIAFDLNVDGQCCDSWRTCHWSESLCSSTIVLCFIAPLRLPPSSLAFRGFADSVATDTANRGGGYNLAFQH